MTRVIHYLFENKSISMILGIIFIFFGFVLRGSFQNYNYLLNFLVPIIIISIGFGVTYSSLFVMSISKTITMFTKATFAPLTIVAVILLFNKYQIDIPVLKATILFIINICFFKNEIKGALKKSTVRD